MEFRMVLIFLFFSLCVVFANEEETRKILDELEESYSEKCNENTIASWNYEVDIENDELKKIYEETIIESAKFQTEMAEKMSSYDYSSVESGELYRRLRSAKDKGTGVLGDDSLKRLQDISTTLKRIYSTATICKYEERNKKGCLKWRLDPDIEEVMATERDWDKLLYVWEEWREASGKKMRKLFIEKNKLLNEAARANGYKDEGERWWSPYLVDQKEVDLFGSDDLKVIDYRQFKDLIDSLWKQISGSLYKKLHAYVRMKLRSIYGNKIDPEGPLPAHLLGNMWAQNWGNLLDIATPFKNQPTYDVTASMQANKWTVKMMFKEADNFFTSIGLFEMTESFWNKSVIDETAWGKKIVCHGSARDFCLGPKSEDFRIKMCTQIDMEDLITVHHEMGHVQYFMAYRNKTYFFRNGANPGFHEAIGDLIALSVSTPTHLENVIGLSPVSIDSSKQRRDNPVYSCDQQKDINALMAMALRKIAFLPFGYLMDKYRLAVFSGSVAESELNAHWWKLREDIQGVAPPSGTRGEDFFDPGAKYHISAYVPYERYFMSYIMQFQFHKNLCSKSGFKGPLHRCDIYNSMKAGAVLKDALELGFSEPWPLVYEKLGGSLEIDTSAIDEYFKPLIDFLDKELDGEYIGWKSSNIGDSVHRAEAGANLFFAAMISIFLFLK